MVHNSTTNLTTALQSIASLSVKERDLLIATLGVNQQQTNNKPTTKAKADAEIRKQLVINQITKHHNAIGYKKNLQRLNKIKRTQKIDDYFHKATAI